MLCKNCNSNYRMQNETMCPPCLVSNLKDKINGLEISLDKRKVYIGELVTSETELKDKLSRRNMQIKDLKKIYKISGVIAQNYRQHIAFLEKFIDDNKLEAPHFEGVTNLDFRLANCE